MQSVELPVQITVPGLLRAVSQLAPSDLDRFLAEATIIQKRNRNEASLLDAINQHLPEHQLLRLRSLEAKLEADAINESERAELLNLVELAETLDVERAEALLALAQKRQTSMEQLIHETPFGFRSWLTSFMHPQCYGVSFSSEQTAAAKTAKARRASAQKPLLSNTFIRGLWADQQRWITSHYLVQDAKDT